MFKRFSLLLALCVPLSAFAADDISNSRDYKKFERFPSSYIVQYKQSQTRDYRLILGGLEKIDGSLRAEKEKRIAGQLTQITYRIPENHSAKEAFEYFYAQIIDQEVRNCSDALDGIVVAVVNGLIIYLVISDYMESIILRASPACN